MIVKNSTFIVWLSVFCLNWPNIMALSWNLSWMKHIRLFFRSQDVQFHIFAFVIFVIFCRFASLPKQWEEYLSEFFVDSPKNEDIYRRIKDCRRSCCRMYIVIIFSPNVYRIIYFFLQTFQLEWQLRRFRVSELVDVKVKSHFFFENTAKPTPTKLQNPTVLGQKVRLVGFCTLVGVGFAALSKNWLIVRRPNLDLFSLKVCQRSTSCGYFIFGLFSTGSPTVIWPSVQWWIFESWITCSYKTNFGLNWRKNGTVL